MNQDRAKEILTSIDPEKAPLGEPGVREALALLDSSEDLQAWEKSERAFDAAMAAKLRAVEAPPALRDQLLSTVQSTKAEPGKSRSESRLMGIPPVVLAAAAAVVVLGIVGITKFLGGPGNEVDQIGPVTFASFQQQMAKTISEGNFRLTKRDKDFGKLQAWVAENGGPVTTTCDKVAKRDCKGCTFLEWGNNKVAMFCVDVDDDTLIHMFVLDRAKFASLPPESQMKSVVRHEGLEAAGWADDDSVYVIVGHDGKTPVTDFF